MCIILTCEKFVRPDYDLLDTCFWNNPDGAGIMWVEDGMVQTEKGFTDPSDLYNAIESIPRESRLVIHMRIATSGGVNTGTCHPFPVCNELELLHEASTQCSAAVAHNGVIHWCPTEKGVSDTIYFVLNVVNPLFQEFGMTKAVRRRIKESAPNNRFAIMTSDGEVYRLGVGWETVKKGIQASNSSWRWNKWPKYTSYSWKNSWRDGWFDGWEDDWNDDYHEQSWNSNALWGKGRSNSYFYELTDEENEALFDYYCHGCVGIKDCMAYGPACDDRYDAMAISAREIAEAREEEVYELV